MGAPPTRICTEAGDIAKKYGPANNVKRLPDGNVTMLLNSKFLTKLSCGAVSAQSYHQLLLRMSWLELARSECS